MRKVITYGIFDLFHRGHYNILKRAKEEGDYLIVGVTGETYDAERGVSKIYRTRCYIRMKNRPALVVGLGLYEAADERRMKVFLLGFSSRSNGPFSAARTGKNAYGKSAAVVRTRRVTNLMMTVDLLQETTDEIEPNGPDGAELQGVGHQHQRASPTSGRTERRCSTCTIDVRSRCWTMHRKASFGLNVDVFNG